MTLQDIIKLEAYAQANKQEPSIVMTEKQAEIYTKIDRILGINHKWKKGDRYYLLLCPIPGKIK